MKSSSKRSSLALLMLFSACTGTVREAPEGSETTTDGFRSPTVIRAAGSIPVREPTTDGDEQHETARPEVEENLCPGSSEPHASGLLISEIALYQTVKIRLYKDGKAIEGTVAPVVQGKKSLVRVFVKRLPGYAAHPVRAVLSLQNGNELPFNIDEEKTIEADSTDEVEDSTFTFKVDGARLAANTRFSVSLQEVDCEAEFGSADEARYPASDRVDLNATAIGKLRVVVVPVKLSNGITPKTGKAELAQIRSYLLAYYPVPDVEVTVRDPLVWTKPVEALTSESWSNLLNGIVKTRKEDAPSNDVYYFGLVQPAQTFGQYCSRGCILGLAPQVTKLQPSAQAGLGAAFGDQQTYETIVHELGHAHGRGHTDCVPPGGEIVGQDPAFPNPGGRIGGWGWDSRDGSFKNPEGPDDFRDIMGYCDPNWISAYNYKALATRSEAVNAINGKAAAKVLALSSTTGRWHHVLAYADGSARWGGTIETEMPGGDTEVAKVLDASGREITQVEVVRIALSHTPDQFLYVPEPKAGWAALQLHDRRLTLTEIKPAL